jgi:hypothetical protein
MQLDSDAPAFRSSRDDAIVEFVDVKIAETQGNVSKINRAGRMH